jgi:hypothetical protein
MKRHLNIINSNLRWTCRPCKKAQYILLHLKNAVIKNMIAIRIIHSIQCDHTEQLMSAESADATLFNRRWLLIKQKYSTWHFAQCSADSWRNVGFETKFFFFVKFVSFKSFGLQSKLWSNLTWSWLNGLWTATSSYLRVLGISNQPTVAYTVSC